VSSSRRFRFVQFEFPWPLGPEPGRYAIREHLGEGVRHVLVVRVLGAPERRLLPRRPRARDAAPQPPPSPVTTSSATLVDTTALDGAQAAERWLRGADLDALAADGVARLNRVLHAHRVATADPAAREVALGAALVARVGYGDGEHVADGRWQRARELPRARVPSALRPGRAALRPQERLAAVLAGRDAVLACEELALRTRADLDAGRWREASMQLAVALDAALAELEPWREQAGIAARLAELRGRRDEVRAAFDAALQGGIEQRQIEVVRSVLGRLEAALRARTAGGAL
jgi:hypothetical protein